MYRSGRICQAGGLVSIYFQVEGVPVDNLPAAKQAKGFVYSRTQSRWPFPVYKLQNLPSKMSWDAGSPQSTVPLGMVIVPYAQNFRRLD
jgi:hypothetical protein